MEEGTRRDDRFYGDGRQTRRKWPLGILTKEGGEPRTGMSLGLPTLASRFSDSVPNLGVPKPLLQPETLVDGFIKLPPKSLFVAMIVGVITAGF
jgi:hypothetical protein